MRGRKDEFSFRNANLRSLRNIHKESGTFGSQLEMMYREEFGQKRHMKAKHKKWYLVT